MTDIISILNNDAVLTSLIGANRVLPDYADDTSTAIVYSFYTSANDGIKKTVRLTLRIIANSLVTIDSIENRVNYLLLTLGDNHLNNNVIQVAQNGGGNLKDPDTGLQHRILYYDVLRKVVYNYGA